MTNLLACKIYLCSKFQEYLDNACQQALMDDLFDDDEVVTKNKTAQSNKEEAKGQKGKKK